jgi:hypothetical protein
LPLSDLHIAIVGQIAEASFDISVEFLELLKKIQLLFKPVNLLSETVVFLYNPLNPFQRMQSF